MTSTILDFINADIKHHGLTLSTFKNDYIEQMDREKLQPLLWAKVAA